jgi:hypothetical protein
MNEILEEEPRCLVLQMLTRCVRHSVWAARSVAEVRRFVVIDCFAFSRFKPYFGFGIPADMMMMMMMMLSTVHGVNSAASGLYRFTSRHQLGW